MTGEERIAPEVMRGLTTFQRRTVRHVVRQFYGARRASRFLVADETGLGKSLVARGVVAQAVDHLAMDEGHDRIDVVYVCSNSDLARQNLRRLIVPGSEERPFASRLTLLGAHSAKLASNGSDAIPVNLVSFTPGTSFDMGHNTGTSSERAMLYLALRGAANFSGIRDEAARRLLQVGVRNLKDFNQTIHWLETQVGEAGIDPNILDRFHQNSHGRGFVAAFNDLVTDTIGSDELTDEARVRRRRLVGELRHVLAEASVETLRPDLIILDEFQRFRDLLNEETAAGELAHHLFRYRNAKVLLLSATPYKPFAYAEEHEESHERDFMQTVRFLANGASDVSASRIRARLGQYRDAVVRGGETRLLVRRLRSDLLKVMSRAERPAVRQGAHSTEVVRTATDVRAEDLAGYAALQRVADAVQEPQDRMLMTPEYWKSAPYFVNFSDGYQLGRRLKDSGGRAVPELASTQHLERERLEDFAEVDPGNARMRALTDATLEKGWWKLLWVPPSLPYLEAGGPFAAPEVAGMTKQLVFSSWAATPASVASILSYEAERRAADGSNYERYTAEARRSLARHLDYVARDGRPLNMSTLLMFLPLPVFADIADPLTIVSSGGGEALPEREVFEYVRDKLEHRLGRVDKIDDGEFEGNTGMRAHTWQAAFSTRGVWVKGLSEAEILSAIAATGTDEGEESQRESSGLRIHLEEIAKLQRGWRVRPDKRALNVIADLSLNSPGNVAYRAIGRLLTRKMRGSADHAVAATIVANGLRGLFNRPHVVKLLEQVTDDAPYWRRVLQYSAWGNLQAVLDEYLHHLRSDQFAGDLDGKSLRELAQAAANAINLRATTYRAMDVEQPGETLPFTAHFALRYGGRQQAVEDARQPEVRNSFNSPFWPFVLTSTSVGQEGIDFHWWCHSVFHWNTPANPVDFEQREGRVDRYRGHAIRKNVMQQHGGAVLQNPSRDPWERAWWLARDQRKEYGDFAPSWVYPGDAKIERHVVPFLLSSDQARYDRVKRDVALYRLTFGQPRQEDMLEFLRDRELDDAEKIENLRVRLDP